MAVGEFTYLAMFGLDVVTYSHMRDYIYLLLIYIKQIFKYIIFIVMHFF